MWRQVLVSQHSLLLVSRSDASKAVISSRRAINVASRFNSTSLRISQKSEVAETMR